LAKSKVVITCDDGTPDFHALRSQHRGHEAVLVAFDLIERDGEDLRDLPLIERKRRLARLISKTKNRRAIRYGEHLKGNGASVLDYVCRLGLEGIVSKRVDAPYRSGPSKTWIKSKNPAMERARLCLPLRLAASQKD
jgi:bifunctional non-homologous end joining protein LigD